VALEFHSLKEQRSEVAEDSVEPKMQLGGFSRNRQDCMGQQCTLPGLSPGTSLSTLDGAVSTK